MCNLLLMWPYTQTFPGNVLHSNGAFTVQCCYFLWIIALDTDKWMICSSGWASSCQYSRKSAQIKHNAHLQACGEPVCVIYHTIKQVQIAVEHWRGLAAAGHWSFLLCSLQTAGREGVHVSTGACSQMHMLSGLLMVLLRPAQFCLDCMRNGSSGQLASLCKWENWAKQKRKAKNKLFFFLLFFLTRRRSGRGEDITNPQQKRLGRQ